jgi:hypothetical protein
MKEHLIENYGAARFEAAVTTAIPPPARRPGRTPENRPRKLAPPVTRAHRLRKAMAKVDAYRAMLHTRCRTPLGLSHELVLVLTNCDGETRPEDNSKEISTATISIAHRKPIGVRNSNP